MPYFLNIYINIVKILTGQHKLILIPKESFMLHISSYLMIHSMHYLQLLLHFCWQPFKLVTQSCTNPPNRHLLYHSSAQFDTYIPDHTLMISPHPIIYNSAFPRHTTAAVLRRFYYSWEGRSQVSRLCLSIAGEKSKRALWVTEAACQARRWSSNRAREWIAEAAGASDTCIISTGRWPMSTFHGTDWSERSSIWIPD